MARRVHDASDEESTSDAPVFNDNDPTFPMLNLQAKPFSFEPILCESAEWPPEHGEWRYELKLDGFRARLRAGKISQARHAFGEALESYQQAIALLSLLPGSSERDIRELQLRESVVRVLMVMRGYAAPETIEATERV